MKKKRILEKIRINVLNRDDFKCLWCGRSSADGVTLDADHVLAEYLGGQATYENLGTLCSHCNRAKGANYFRSYLLITIFKVRNFENWFEDKLVGHNIGREAYVRTADDYLIDTNRADETAETLVKSRRQFLQERNKS